MVVHYFYSKMIHAKIKTLTLLIEYGCYIVNILFVHCLSHSVRRLSNSRALKLLQFSSECLPLVDVVVIVLSLLQRFLYRVVVFAVTVGLTAQ